VLLDIGATIMLLCGLGVPDSTDCECLGGSRSGKDLKYNNAAIAKASRTIAVGI
jgi:hypothetical protein